MSVIHPEHWYHQVLRLSGGVTAGDRLELGVLRLSGRVGRDTAGDCSCLELGVTAGRVMDIPDKQ